PEQPFSAETVYIRGLGYDNRPETSLPPENIADAIIRAITTKWKGGCDILHVHNPLLNKNANLLKILKILQKKNISLFLQIHDFAEDGRPQSYFPDEYLQDCHYGVINTRDYDILIDAGLKSDGLHKIPNTIKFFDLKQKNAIPFTPVLYPIRAIRRKNIGEAILLSLFFRNNAPLAFTLPPNSPSDIRSYEGWKAFVEEKRLNVLFDAGLSYEFSDLVLASESLMTTSVTEGFGFSFLEPWTAKKFLWGRRLPDICSDFINNGVQLDHLYTRLHVPIEWVGKKKLYQRWRSCVLKNSARFNIPIDNERLTTSFEKTTRNNIIDFGLLDETFQQGIISGLLSSSAYRDRVIRLNAHLESPGRVSNQQALIEKNRSAVIRNYNKSLYQKRLFKAYTRVIKTSVVQKINKSRLLQHFFTPEAFSLLKWGDDVDA
ncbi:MAG: hypothetical protein JRF27_07070, partial [Deltaproteobacteria bacterium]|nr:hypothetical protein [Deltaproteobacteria bacterium]